MKETPNRPRHHEKVCDPHCGSSVRGGGLFNQMFHYIYKTSHVETREAELCEIEKNLNNPLMMNRIGRSMQFGLKNAFKTC